MASVVIQNEEENVDDNQAH